MMRRLLAMALFLSLGAHGADDGYRYRCNTHTHTSARPGSDANGAPELVVNWYRAHDYQCLVITDHEYVTDVAALDSGEDDGFLVIAGQEITQTVRDHTHPHGLRHAHVNAIGSRRVIMPVGYPDPPETTTLAEVYEGNLERIRADGAIAQINHPNLHWSVRPSDLAALEGPLLLEVWNAFPSSNNLGGDDGEGNESLSTEELWDDLLTQGKVVWAVASDDVHEYVTLDDREAPTPGKGWIVVRAAALTRPAMMEALRSGSFYASTGITLVDIDTDAEGMSLQLQPGLNWNSTRPLLTRYRTRFIGAGGEVLDEVAGLTPSYAFRGGEIYVRAVITDSDGRRAWTQPVYPGRDLPTP